jgi:hypothetical protein
MTTRTKVEEYRERHPGYLRLLGLRIEQVPPEIGEPEQSLTVTLLSKNGSLASSTRFTGVQQLRVDGVLPGFSCYLEIVPVESHQLEGLNYQVFNIEQDVTLAFYCRDFEIE